MFSYTSVCLKSMMVLASSDLMYDALRSGNRVRLGLTGGMLLSALVFAATCPSFPDDDPDDPDDQVVSAD